MPELPEVETVRRGLEPAMRGKSIRKVDLHRDGLRMPFPADLPKILKNREILRLSRRAKYLLIHLSGANEDILIIHLGMSGQLTIITDIKTYKPKKHDHMILTLDDGTGIVFNDARRFGMVMLSSASEIGDHAAFRNIGPEPLSNNFSGEVLREKLKGKSTSIKVALLDQNILAGIGNIYASEALYDAGITPLKKAGDITAKAAEKLAASIRHVLNKAIESGGSSLKDFIRVDGKPGYFQHSFCVYDKEGHACPRCAKNGKKKATIKKFMQSGRATYFCPSCQK